MEIIFVVVSAMSAVSLLWNLLEHFFHVWEFENTGIKIEPDVHDTFHDRLEEILMDLFT